MHIKNLPSMAALFRRAFNYCQDPVFRTPDPEMNPSDEVKSSGVDVIGIVAYGIPLTSNCWVYMKQRSYFPAEFSNEPAATDLNFEAEDHAYLGVTSRRDAAHLAGLPHQKLQEIARGPEDNPASSVEQRRANILAHLQRNKLLFRRSP
jgi:hypothetical protein